MLDLSIPDSDGVVAPPALGPGDDDPRSPAAGTALAAAAPPLPGASVGDNPDDGFHFLAPAPLGPGDQQLAPRHVVRIPKSPSPSASAAHDNEKE